MTNRTLMWRDLASLDVPALGNRNLALSDWPADLYPSHLGDISARLCIRVIEACDQLKLAMKTPSINRGDRWDHRIRAIAKEILVLDQAIKDCYQHEAQEWQPRRTTVQNENDPSRFLKPELLGLSNAMLLEADWSSIPKLRIMKASKPLGDRKESTSCPSHIDVYPSHSVATLWNSVRVLRLYVLRAMVDLWILDYQRNIGLREDLPAPETLYTQMSSTVEEICASVPFLMGDVDDSGNLRAFQGRKSMKPTATIGLIWTLHRLCRIPALQPSVKSWLFDNFTRIGGTGGLKVALAMRRMHEGTGSSTIINRWA